MRKILSILCFVSICSCCLAQSSISLGIGYGIDHGGLGGKISIKPVENLAVVGGLGNYFGPPLSLVFIDAPTPTKQNLNGLGYSVGLEYFYGNPRFGGGLHYIRTGKYYGKVSFQGINWCMFGGDVHFNKVSLFVHYGANITFLFYGGEIIGGMLGISLGIGYSFFF